MSKRFIDTKEFADVMRKINHALVDYDWALIGGRSVEVWANPPQTPDVDCLVKFKARDTDKLLASMKRHGFILERKFFDPKYVPMLFFKDDTLNVEVDIIGAFEDVHLWAIERSVKRTVSGVKFPVAQPEDVVMLKANAALTPRRGEKAERDVAAIKAIAKDNSLDTDYIEIVLSQALIDWSDERKLLVDLGVLRNG